MVSFLHWLSTHIFLLHKIVAFIIVYTVVHFEPTFPTEFWNVCQWACDNILRINNTVGNFHNVIQSSVTDMHPSIWKLILLLMMEEILVEKEKNAMLNKEKNQQVKIKCITLWAKDFEDKCLGIIHKIKSVPCRVLPWICTTHFECIQIFLNYLIKSFEFCYSFFMFHYVLFNEYPSLIFHDFIFHGRVALCMIS